MKAQPSGSLTAGNRGKSCGTMILSVAAVHHDLEDGAVRLPHPFLCQNADIGDGVVYALGHNAVAAFEFLMVAVHVIAQDARVHALAAILAAQGGLSTD